MSLDRKHVAIAAFTGLVSWLLVTHLVPSFRWIPYAFVAGALATLFGIAYFGLTSSRPVHHGTRNNGSRALPAFITRDMWENEKAALKARSTYKRKQVYPKSRDVSKGIDQLLDLIMRDFVTSWYKNISSRPLFQNEIDRAIRDAMLSIRERLSSLDVVEIAISRVVPIITDHMQEFYTAERLVRGKNLTRDMTESEELDLAIAGKYKDGRLHKAASLGFSDTKLMQQAHVRKTISNVLPLVMSEDMQTSPSVLTLVREIVACAVIAPILLMLMDPDTWNQLIENFGRSLLQDRKTVRKLRAALDEHAPPSPTGGRPVDMPRLRPGDSERQFERFIRAIRRTTTLSDARRFRSEIISQSRKISAAGEQDLIFLRRLEAGRQILEQKIAVLSAGGTSATRPKLASVPSSAPTDAVTRLRDASLSEVLHNASGLSYFMEFMDRRDRMRLVQFWIIIDGFRNPLEEDTDEPGATFQEQITYNSADRMDLGQIKGAYLDLPEVHMSRAGRIAVDTYLKAGKSANMQLYVTARRAILKAQTGVYEEMREEHFAHFKRSDLFYKWLATEDASAAANSLSNASSSPTRSVSDTGPDAVHRAARPPTAPPVVHKTREPDLRRAALSSIDLKSAGRSSLPTNHTRRSVDDNAARPLFDDDVEDERMTRSAQSIASFDSDSEQMERHDESSRLVDAMQKELNDIMDEPQKDSLFSDQPLKTDLAADSPRIPDDTAVSPQLGSRPNIATLGLVGGHTSSAVFVDDLFAEEEEKFLADEKEDSDDHDRPVEDDIHEAAPGDLGLVEAIHVLNADIDRLAAQENIIDSLTKKAELTNNAAELRILRKSKQSLQREIHRKEMQKQQYVIQESDNSLFGRAAVNIQSIMVGKEEDGHEFAIYVIEVRRQAGDQMPAATWTIARRYSEFHELNKRLRAKFSAVRHLDFPSRQTIFTLQKDFLQKRRAVLERYLRALLLIPAICRSRELRAFLSQAAISPTDPNGNKLDPGDFVTRIYNSVSDGMEDLLGNLPALDQLSVAGQNLITAASAQLNGDTAGSVTLDMPHDLATAAEVEAEITAFDDRETEPFVKPISDLFLETFELHKGNSWLRGRAVVVVLHQLLGGTVERKVRDTAKTFLEPASLIRYMSMAQEIMWPNGVMKQPSIPRTSIEKAQSRKEATLVLATLIPDMAASVVGRTNAQAASRKISAVLNNQRLNIHLVMTLFDELVNIIFPECIGR